MTGLVRKAMLLSACGTLFAAAAMAGVPSPANSGGWLVGGGGQSYIRVVGTNLGTPDPNGAFTLTVRDLGNNPLPNVQVVVDLGACSDARLCSGPAAAGQTIDCPTKTVRGFTNGSGQITFNIVGAGVNTGAVAGPGVGCANIVADGVSLTHPTVNLIDENGAATANGVEVTDLSAWLKDLGTGFYFGRSDFDQLGTVDVVDLSRWLNFLGTGFSASGCSTTYCTP